MPQPAPLSAFADLPDEARLWLLAFDRAVEATRIAPEMELLLGRWRHKGVQYRGAWTLLEGRILAIAEPTLAVQPSGCAIDGMLRGVRQAAERIGSGLQDPQDVVVRQPDGLGTFSRADLEARLADGTLGPGTMVLDLALLTLGELRSGRFERPLASTWIGRKYKIQAPETPGA